MILSGVLTANEIKNKEAVKVNKNTYVLVDKKKCTPAYRMKVKEKYASCTGKTSVRDII
jgi:hypothetical protein